METNPELLSQVWVTGSPVTQCVTLGKSLVTSLSSWRLLCKAEISRHILQGYSDANMNEIKCVKAERNKEKMLFLFLLAVWGIKGESGHLPGGGGELERL